MGAVFVAGAGHSGLLPSAGQEAGLGGDPGCKGPVKTPLGVKPWSWRAFLSVPPELPSLPAWPQGRQGVGPTEIRGHLEKRGRTEAPGLTPRRPLNNPGWVGSLARSRACVRPHGSVQ